MNTKYEDEDFEPQPITIDMSTISTDSLQHYFDTVLSTMLDNNHGEQEDENFKS